MYFQSRHNSVQVFEYSGYDPVHRRRKIRYLGSFSVHPGYPIKVSDRLRAALDTAERKKKFELLLSDFFAHEQIALEQQRENSILDDLIQINQKLQQIQISLPDPVVRAIQKEAQAVYRAAQKLNAKGRKQKPSGQLSLIAQSLALSS